MKARSLPSASFRPFAFPTIFLLLFGWGGLIFLILTIRPTVWGRWLFYVLWVLGLTGAALPFTFAAHRLALVSDPSLGKVVVRQALWVGVYGAILAWLQLSRLAGLWTAVTLAIGLIAIEAFIRLREKSRWHPPSVAETSSSDLPDEE
ncbi:MAG: hypothetical protein ACUVRJ_09205 [Candidatus Villigracilaceae bacterium]